MTLMGFDSCDKGRIRYENLKKIITMEKKHGTSAN